ncbi:MAG: class I SAM-dependent methyltransferase [Bacteroidota bacterium]|nr:class I SAM-dependent methyltransferase [Bacteroidota bacterium]
MSPFEKATESGWYPHFLQPVIDSINNQGHNLKILDLGTGTGKLPELLITQDSTHYITGIDIDSVFIKNAKVRVNHPHVNFDFQKINSKLDFPDSSFDIVTICSVLFLIDDATKQLLYSEALRILKPEGKIIVLTPSGKKSRISAFSDLRRFKNPKYNWTYILWKNLTMSGGQRWLENNWLKNMASENHLSYNSTLVFDENAYIEIITKQ